MAWAYRASSYADNGGGFTSLNSGDSRAVTLAAAASSGDALVLCILGFNSGVSGGGGTDIPTFAVSDSVNGSTGWAETKTQTALGMAGVFAARQSTWLRPNSAAGTPVITVTFTVIGVNSRVTGGLMCAAFSGLVTSSPLDTSASANAAAGANSSPDSGAVSPATAAANELVIGHYNDLGDNVTLAAGLIGGSAATLAGKHESDGNFWEGLLEYRDSGSSGATPHATVTPGGATNWLMLEAVLAITGGAPPQDTPELYGRPRLIDRQMQQLLAQ